MCTGRSMGSAVRQAAIQQQARRQPQPGTPAAAGGGPRRRNMDRPDRVMQQGSVLTNGLPSMTGTPRKTVLGG